MRRGAWPWKLPVVMQAACYGSVVACALNRRGLGAGRPAAAAAATPEGLQRRLQHQKGCSGGSNTRRAQLEREAPNWKGKGSTGKEAKHTSHATRSHNLTHVSSLLRARSV
eukprot:355713-Chlamydomonas_euryale.AAC.2